MTYFNSATLAKIIERRYWGNDKCDSFSFWFIVSIAYRCLFTAIAQEITKEWLNGCIDSFLFEFETRLNENKSSQNPVLKTPLQQQLPKATWP